MHKNLKNFHKAFEYPFSFMNVNYDDRYSLENISMTMFGNDMKAEKIDLNHVIFPGNIKKIYFYKEGKNDISPWYFIGEISYEEKSLYIYYEGLCDYTGFDCQGSMKLYISEHYDRIIDRALPENVRKKYFYQKSMLEKGKKKCSLNNQQNGDDYNKLAYLRLKNS